MSRQTPPSRGSSGTVPAASIPRMLLSPFLRLLRRLPISVSPPSSSSSILTPLILSITAAAQRLDLSLDPRQSLHRISAHKFTLSNTIPLIFMFLIWTYALLVMSTPPFPIKLGIPLLWAIGAIIPLTGQFVWPATPIFTWLILFFSARFIPSSRRPGIHVALLPALESVLYGANISDLQTRFTHPLLDVLAWVPYGVLHFALPFIVAAILFVWGPRGSTPFWGRAFGFMNAIGVITQILLPCAAPWYEIIHGLTPANYSMSGSPGGLLRIDRVFHSSGYTNTFGSAPLVFGAFPSLHSGCAVMEALFLSHFFPSLKPLYWGYVGILWWATMYLSHHYLIDLTGGACLSVLVFYLFMPEEFKDVDQINWTATASGGGGGGSSVTRREEYEMLNQRDQVEMDLDEEIRKLEEEGEADITSTSVSGKEEQVEEDDEESRIGRDDLGKSRTKRSVSWGETKVLGEE